MCGGLGRAIVVLRLLAIKVSCLPHKQLHFEEVKSKDKGPMFALLWKTRTVLRSISNNLKEHHHQTKDTAENYNGFRDLSRAGFFCARVCNNYDFPCMQSWRPKFMTWRPYFPHLVASWHLSKKVNFKPYLSNTLGPHRSLIKGMKLLYQIRVYLTSSKNLFVHCPREWVG